MRANLALAGLIGLVLAGCGSGATNRSPHTAAGVKAKVEQQLVATRKKIDASHGHRTIGNTTKASCAVKTSTTLLCNVIDLNLTPFGAERVKVVVDPTTGQTRTTVATGSR